MSDKKSSDAKKLAAFFRSQGVPLASREHLLGQLNDACRKAIVAAVSDKGEVSRPAVEAYRKALDEHRVRVREAAVKPAKPTDPPAEKPAPEKAPD